MGGSTYSDKVFDDTYSRKTAAGASYFAHTAAIRSGTKAAKVDEKLDPSRKNKAGQIIRESLDSDINPESTAIAVLFDVTGSMEVVPQTFVKKLGSLMALITKKGYVSNPHVLFGAIGDAYSDEVPLQIGQFEGGNEMDDVLGDIYLEGNGGGQETESYELGMYFMARHTKLDCLDKRGKRGYLFISGDELPKAKVSKDQVERLIGVKLENDISLKDILTELKEKFEVFWILPKGTMYWDREDLNEQRQKLFGQNFLKLENPEDVAELIVTTIGIAEGFDPKSIEKDLIDAGSSKSSVKNASTALAAFVGNAVTRKTGTIDGSLIASKVQDGVERL